MKKRILIIVFSIICIAAQAQEEPELKRSITNTVAVKYPNVFTYEVVTYPGLESRDYNMNFKDKSFLRGNEAFINRVLGHVHDTRYNRCKASSITISWDVDTAGNISNVNLPLGTQNQIIDSILTQKIYSIKDSSHSAMVDGKAFNVSVVFKITYTLKDMYFFFTQLKSNIDCRNNYFYYEKGLKNFETADYKSAISDFKMASSYNGSDEDSYYNLAICYFKINETEKACKCLKEGMALYDKSATNLYSKKCKNNSID